MLVHFHLNTVVGIRGVCVCLIKFMGTPLQKITTTILMLKVNIISFYLTYYRQANLASNLEY